MRCVGVGCRGRSHAVHAQRLATNTTNAARPGTTVGRAAATRAATSSAAGRALGRASAAGRAAAESCDPATEPPGAQHLGAERTDR